MDITISSCFEIFAAIFGLIQGILVMQNRRSNWIFYLLHIGLLFLFSAANHLWGDMINNIVYFGMGIYGAISWRPGGTNGQITTYTISERLLYTLMLVIATIVVGNILKNTSDPLPWIDTFTTTSGFLATWFMIKRKLEAWVLWTINDLIYIVEYALLPQTAYWLLGLNIIWTVLAICSFIKWKQLIQNG